MEKNSRLQFWHERKWHCDYYFDGSEHTTIFAKGGITLAVLVPTLAEIEAMEISGEYGLQLGIAKCHEDDNFNKRIGRVVSTGRMAEVKAKVLEKFILHDQIYITLRVHNIDIQIYKRFDKEIARIDCVEIV
jgi:hypothetical protein